MAALVVAGVVIVLVVRVAVQLVVLVLVAGILSSPKGELGLSVPQLWLLLLVEPREQALAPTTAPLPDQKMVSSAFASMLEATTESILKEWPAQEQQREGLYTALCRVSLYWCSGARASR